MNSPGGRLHLLGGWNDIQQRYARAVDDLGPPMASIDRVRIRDFREVGARQTVRVTIKNTGKLTLTEGAWLLTCNIEEHPDHYRPSPNDFACEETLDKDIDPGRTYSFSLPFTAPEAAGEWELEVVFKANRKTLDTAVVEVLVEE